MGMGMAQVVRGAVLGFWISESSRIQPQSGDTAWSHPAVTRRIFCPLCLQTQLLSDVIFAVVFFFFNRIFHIIIIIFCVCV